VAAWRRRARLLSFRETCNGVDYDGRRGGGEKGSFLLRPELVPGFMNSRRAPGKKEQGKKKKGHGCNGFFVPLAVFPFGHTVIPEHDGEDGKKRGGKSV